MKFLIYYIVFCIAIGITHGQVYIEDTGFRNCLIENYPGVLGPGDSLDLDAAASLQGDISCPNRGISDISALIFFDSITTLNFNRNQIEDASALSQLLLLERVYISEAGLISLPDFSSHLHLRILHCWDNDLQSIPSVPSTIEDIDFGRNDFSDTFDFNAYPMAKHISIYGNNFQSTTGYENLDSISELNLASNKLTFEDLVPLSEQPYFNSLNLSYSPQNNVGDTLVETIQEGSSWELSLTIDQDLTTNTFEWFIEDSSVYSSNSPSFALGPLNRNDAGDYYCQITNPAFPDLTLRSNPVTLNILTPNPADEELAFSPDNDGYADEFYIEKTGNIQIFNKLGEEVKTLEGPTFWDGKNNQNLELPVGYYLITVNNTPFTGVTIVR